MTSFLPITISCVKAYDIRGELGVSLDEHIAYRVGRAFGEYLNPTADTSKTIVVGADIRPSSDALKRQMVEGLTDSGTSVIDLGMTGTEEVYFATSHYGAIGGIEVTASHNPINYNGMKLVRENSKPISLDTGLADIQKLAESGAFKEVNAKGNYELNTDKSAYIAHLLSYINLSNLTPLKVVVNCGNGSAAPVVDLLENEFNKQNAPISFIKINHEPDGSFPNGIPNPMIVANRTVTSQAVLDNGANLAIAFDGDFDRCFFFDETGRFIEGTYLVGVLAKAFLDKEQGASIVYDPRNVLNTESVIKSANGVAKVSKSGHSFIKQVMRETNAVYGGEMSAHHYFREFNYCDSGMIVWLVVLELIAKSGKSLSKLVDEMIDNFPISGEINFKLTSVSAKQILAEFEQSLGKFDNKTPSVDTLDGLSVNFDDWRFNVRASNTEPLVRLNVESVGDKALLDDKTKQLCDFIIAKGGEFADH
ncbi:MAG: phosphomannomutase CpsG [Moraxella sp.]|nr:phosphomannomutase CpsG [Moraxella sp.]